VLGLTKTCCSSTPWYICCYLLFSRNLLQPSLHHPCLSIIPSCTWYNLNTSGSPSPLMQLGLHTSTLFAWNLGGSLAHSTVSSIVMHADTPSLLKLYLTTVRPHLEYASSVWGPYLKKDIEAIECVQMFGLKVCLKNWHCSYDNLLNIANIPLLASRRWQLKLCQLFSGLTSCQKSISIPVQY